MSMQIPVYDHHKLLNRLGAIGNSRVLVVGDMMLDRFVYGRVERISPESPVPVLNTEREKSMLGGSGNALANLAGLGAQARIVSLIGDDAAGQQIRALVEALGYSAQSLIVDQSRPTTIKTRFLAGHQQLLRTDSEDRSPVSSEILERAVDEIKRQINEVQVVLLSDYNKGLLTPAFIRDVIAMAKKKNVPVIADPKGHDYSKYSGVRAITPNKKELSEATKGHSVQDDTDIVKACGVLIQECGIDAVVATRSGEGLSVVDKARDPVHVRSDGHIEVFDVSGAGDTVIAVIAAALAAGADLSEAGYLANLAGSIVVTKVGTAAIRAQDMVNALSERRRVSYYTVNDLSQAIEQVERWQARGLRVGFTNGCFDILHFGHVSYLNEASRHCDRLIVGLNSDRSVRILKGPDRPVHDEQARAGVITGLAAVDMVVMFGAEQDGNDNTACAVLSVLKPDVYFKGGDYREEDIPEAPSVRAYGGQIKLMPEYSGHSTTASIQKIKA